MEINSNRPNSNASIAADSCFVRSECKQKSLALASIARDDPPASSTAAAMRGKVGSEFGT